MSHHERYDGGNEGEPKGAKRPAWGTVNVPVHHDPLGGNNKPAAPGRDECDHRFDHDWVRTGLLLGGLRWLLIGLHRCQPSNAPEFAGDSAHTPR